MRVVLDTNVIISGFLWNGTPKEILGFAESETIVIYCSQEILAEMEHVLSYPKFKLILSQIGKTPHDIINEFLEIASPVPSTALAESPHLEDRTDEKFLACAVAAGASYIISGDKHLLRLKTFQRIDIVSATAFLRQFKKR